MGTKVAVGTLLGVILLIIVLYFAFPNPGKKALQHEQLALNDVTSWRIATQISKNSRPKVSRTHVAICPDKEHILENDEGDFSEYIRIGDDEYYRKNTYQWIKGAPGPDLFLPLPTPRPCLSNPGEPSSRPPGGAEEMRLALEGDIKEGKIDKGQKKDYRGSPCQEWTIMRFGGSKLGSYTTCLSESDNLPRYIRDVTENFYMYFEWGPSLTIEPPDLTPPGKMPTAP
jgi:hypothetical protein